MIPRDQKFHTWLLAILNCFLTTVVVIVKGGILALADHLPLEVGQNSVFTKDSFANHGHGGHSSETIGTDASLSQAFPLHGIRPQTILEV